MCFFSVSYSFTDAHHGVFCVDRNMDNMSLSTVADVRNEKKILKHVVCSVSKETTLPGTKYCMKPITDHDNIIYIFIV